ncbi:MAG TPA: biotin transporter BioY [Rubrobacter sp.]|nr:biotin transporter BioY [Rubrobacter sp.]
MVKGDQYQPAVAGVTVSFIERLALKASTITRVALMAAVTAVAAQITIPLFPVPFTLQVLAVILSGLLLGVRHGALAQAVYVLVGAVGVPVFAGFTGGLGHIFGPTGGYLISYPIAAAVAGIAAKTVAGDSRTRRYGLASSGDARASRLSTPSEQPGSPWSQASHPQRP